MKKHSLLILAIVVISHLLNSQTINHQWNSLTATSQASYDQALQQNQGIAGIYAFYPDKSYIGMDPVSVEWDPRGRPTHRPIDGYKRAHTGFLSTLYRGSSGVFDDDDDVILYINPNPGDKPYEDYIATGKTSKRKIEGEIDVNTAFAGSIMSKGPLLYSQITGYGAWIHEKHDYWDSRVHDYLEIHPCENIWWSELANGKMKYTIGVYSDNSGRFNKWRPNPVDAVNGITFEFTTGSKPLNYTMQVLTSLHMVPSTIYNDHATIQYLKDGNDTIAIVQEQSSPNISFSIDFNSVSKTSLSNGKFLYKGFMKIYTAVKDGGHTIFSVRESRGVPVSRRPVEITVTLESIRCISVDDGNDTEELYGSYGISAVTGASPFHTNAFTYGTTNNFLWKKERGNTLNLKKGQVSMVNGKRIFTVSPAGELVLYGDIDEDDGGGDDDDKLGSPYMEKYPVSSLSTTTPKIITHTHQSGGTKIEVRIKIERKNNYVEVERPVIIRDRMIN